MRVAAPFTRTALAIAVFVVAMAPGVSGQTETHRRMEHVNKDASGWALKGYDPVGYHEGWAQKGKPQFVQTYKGVRYRFASEEHLRMFREDPEKYEPACGGWCALAMIDGDMSDINPRHFRKIAGRVYLFSSSLLRNALVKWDELAEAEGEEALARRADAAWQEILAE